jgi:hypothetical protein
MNDVSRIATSNDGGRFPVEHPVEPFTQAIVLRFIRKIERASKLRSQIVERALGAWFPTSPSTAVPESKRGYVRFDGDVSLLPS